MSTTKTIYPESGKVVLESGQTGLMISSEYYDELIGNGMTDDQIFQELRVY